MYLKAIGRVPLLTVAQEVDLAMRVEAGGLAAELLASVDPTNKVDLKRFRLVVHSVALIRECQLDPNRPLEGAEAASLSGIGANASPTTG